MSKPRLVEDIGAPVAVAAVDIAMEKFALAYHDWAIYAMTALGYIGAYMNFGGDFVKQVGVASAPLTLRKLYEKFAITGVPRMTAFNPALAYQQVSRYPADVYTSEFAGNRLV